MALDAVEFQGLSAYLTALLDIDPDEAIRIARQIEIQSPDSMNEINLRATTLVEGGALARQLDAIEEGLALLRELHTKSPLPVTTYNLANALAAIAGIPNSEDGWLNHQERTQAYRAEARRCFWKVANDLEADPSLRSQAWTNLANQFSNSYRFGEAHDAWLAALKCDPENGVAAFAAARNMQWFYERGGCSELTHIEAVMLAKSALRNIERVAQYAGLQAARHTATFANQFDDPPARSPHTDPFISWVERERLTLAPTVELVDTSLGELDWLMLPDILEVDRGDSWLPPPVFAMFNMLKSDFIVARDLTWRALDKEGWPVSGRYSDTLDSAVFGPDVSALTLAHRTALDLLDKIAVTANHYFALGQAPERVYFGKLWRRRRDKTASITSLTETVERVILSEVPALYGLTELADDYDDIIGILHPHKHLRNAGTHRFVVLYDSVNQTQSRHAPEIDRHRRDKFYISVLSALRVARSAIQLLALSITQHEQNLSKRENNSVASLILPDHT